MRFGPVPVGEATGAILARSLSTANGRIRKGKVLTAGDIAALAAAGHQEITGVRLDPGDMGEDEAAEPIAAALVPDPAAAGLRLTEAATGQVNIRATGPGVLGFDAATIEAANRVDPMITIATLPTFARTRVRGMVATVKIISYGVAEHLVRAAAGRASGAMRHHPDPGRLCHLGPCRCRARGFAPRRWCRDPVRPAGRSGEPLVSGASSGASKDPPGDRPAGLRAVARVERCRLGVGTGGLRAAGDRCRHGGDGGWAVS